MDDYFRTTAYHKSSSSSATKSIFWQNYYTCKKDDAWLGTGIYFWERKTDAERWDGHYTNPIITSAILCCPWDLYLNLDSEDGLAELKYFLDFYQKKLESLRIGIDFSSENIYLASPIFCELFKTTNGTLLIKYSFPQINNRPQYCATDGSIVSEIQIASIINDGKWKWI